MAASFQLVPQGIACHSYNKDRTRELVLGYCLQSNRISLNPYTWRRVDIALSPNNNELVIYGGCEFAISSWKEKYRLGEHDMNISCIDWSHVTNQIVTCGHDRNAFVWTFNEGEAKWEPSLVILRIEHAALHCRWSPNGKKFAVTSSSKCVQVCHYESDNKWWVSKQIKKPHKSSVLCVAWHPNNQLLITGAADFKCRLFSAYAPGNEATGRGPDYGTEQNIPFVGSSPLPFADM